MADLSKLWPIARREYVERVRTRWFIISTIAAPVIFSLLAVLPVLLTSRDRNAVAPRVIVIDATGAGLGHYVMRGMSGAPTPDEKGLQADVRIVSPAQLPAAESTATDEVTQRLASGYVTLDSATLRGDSAHYAGRRGESQQARITQAIRAGLVALRLEKSGLAAGTIDSALAVPTPVVHTSAINDAGRSTASPAKTLVAAFVAFFLYMSIVLYGQSMLGSVIEEKTTRVAEIVISSVSPDLLLAGKILGTTAVALTQQIVWVAGSIALIMARGALFGASAAQSPAGSTGGMQSSDFLTAVIATPWSWVVLVLLFFLVGFVFYGALFAAVGSTVGSEQDARPAAQPVILLLVATAVFISPVVANPGSQLATVMSILPFSSPILMPLRMAVTDVPVWQIAASLGCLALGCVGAVWLAARIYRVGLLMYGKRPSLAELRRWIAAA
jgi:ABC-2 type transport system permease protein